MVKRHALEMIIIPYSAIGEASSGFQTTSCFQQLPPVIWIASSNAQELHKHFVKISAYKTSKYVMQSRKQIFVNNSLSRLALKPPSYALAPDHPEPPPPSLLPLKTGASYEPRRLPPEKGLDGKLSAWEQSLLKVRMRSVGGAVRVVGVVVN